MGSDICIRDSIETILRHISTSWTVTRTPRVTRISSLRTITFRRTRLACRNSSDVRRTMDHNGQAFAFYYMASKDYKKAIPAINAILKQPDISTYMRQKYYGMIMEAAKAIGDNENYILAMEQFIDQSKQIDSLRKITMRREIMLRDSIITQPLLYLDSTESPKKDSRTYRSQTTWIVISSVLALLLIIYAILYFKLRVRKSGR